MVRHRLSYFLVLLVVVCGWILTGCSSKQPEPNGKGYYEGPGETKGTSGKSAGGMPPAQGNPP